MFADHTWHSRRIVSAGRLVTSSFALKATSAGVRRPSLIITPSANASRYRVAACSQFCKAMLRAAAGEFLHFMSQTQVAFAFLVNVLIRSFIRQRPIEPNKRCPPAAWWTQSRPGSGWFSANLVASTGVEPVTVRFSTERPTGCSQTPIDATATRGPLDSSRPDALPTELLQSMLPLEPVHGTQQANCRKRQG